MSVAGGPGTRQPPGEALLRMVELLADGEWHDGAATLRAMQRAVPPGVASRKGATLAKDPGVHDTETLIEMGRKSIARNAMAGAMARGRVVTDVEGVGRAHWGGREPWRVRDLLAGALSMAEAAAQLGVEDYVLRNWVSKGYVPATTVGTSTAHLTPAHMDVARRVRAAYRPGGRWMVEPRSLWTAGADGAPSSMFACPHCGEPVTVTLGKP